MEDPLTSLCGAVGSHSWIEEVQRHHSGEIDDRVRSALHLTINGGAAGLWNSG
ncbi:protein of unknown function [Georgfuchsia toluolica]|uniref:Uncharacterized protein n=1 Tax=Georgfuchsia toluolica TaxID=424218 RepID=A0A916N1A8_9PROT|nr:hypothetical protein [Georgfuchsia toluolica]CAG4882455.1 protein of unknown function [Georgfuchsia toluolica]